MVDGYEIADIKKMVVSAKIPVDQQGVVIAAIITANQQERLMRQINRMSTIAESFLELAKKRA